MLVSHDTGNNFNSRDSFTIYRIAWDALNEDSGNVEAERITFGYEDYQAGDYLSHNFDAEALAVRGDELWLFTKNRGDGHSNLFRFPKTPGQYMPSPSQSLPVDALITAVDIHPATGDLLLLGSRGRWLGRVIQLWLVPTSEAGVDWESAKSVQLEPPDQWEAVAWDRATGNIYLTHEDNARGYAGMARLHRHAFKSAAQRAAVPAQ